MKPDKKLPPPTLKRPSPQNVQGLLQDLVERLDARARELRAGTKFAHVRPGDAKVFMMISRHPRSASELAQALSVSRQSCHETVQRLVEMGVVSLLPSPYDGRVKIATTTAASAEAFAVAVHVTGTIEAEMIAKIGAKHLKTLQGLLLDLLSDGA